MPKKKYTHLFFDLDNTLWDFEKNSYRAMHETFFHFKLENQGVDFPHFFNAYSKHNHRLWGDYRKGAVVKTELKRLRFGLTFDELNVRGIDPLEMNAFYLAKMPGQKLLIEGAVDLLNYLKKKGYSLFIITNGFREVQHKKLEVTGLKKYFTKVFISEEVKTPKPGKEMFGYAVKSANAKKTGSLMVGDDWEVDVLGALNFGIDAVYFNPNGKTSPKNRNEFIRKDSLYLVNLLSELKTIL